MTPQGGSRGQGVDVNFQDMDQLQVPKKISKQRIRDQDHKTTRQHKGMRRGYRGRNESDEGTSGNRKVTKRPGQ